MRGNGLWQRVWGALPLLDRGNIEVTWVEHFWDKANFSGKRQDVTSMLPVGARGNIGQALCISAFQTMILPRYLFFRVVNKNRGLHFWLRIFGILRIMWNRVEIIRYEFWKILHDFWKILMEYFSKIVLLFGCRTEPIRWQKAGDGRHGFLFVLRGWFCRFCLIFVYKKVKYVIFS